MVGTNNVSIFLIDDDDLLLEMYSLKFINAGYKVEIAKGVEEALEKIRQGLKPDAVLLDLVMPHMDGFDFLTAVKKENLIPGSKIIILSNLGQKEDLEKGMALGATDFIIKASLIPSEVIKKVESMLEINKK